MRNHINIHLVKYEIDDNDSVKPVQYDESFEYSETTLLSELLCFYAEEEYPICNKHIRLDRCLHYLIRDNHVEWLVSTKECTICEYLDCFNEETIELEMPTGIGGVVEIFKFLIKILDIAQKLDWLYEKLKKTSLGILFKSFQSDSGRYIDQTDLKAFVVSQCQWKLSDFMNLLRCYDEEIVKGILQYYGFENVESDIYVFNNDKMLINQEKFYAYDYHRETMIDKLLLP